MAIRLDKSGLPISSTRLVPQHKRVAFTATLRKTGLPRKLQGRFDFETPGLEQRLRNVLGILVPPGPFPQAGRAEILVGGKFVLVHYLLELRNGGSDRPDRLGLAPVRVSTSLCHEKCIL